MCIHKSECVVYMSYIDRHMWLRLVEGGTVARHQGLEVAQQPGCAPLELLTQLKKRKDSGWYPMAREKQIPENSSSAEC